MSLVVFIWTVSSWPIVDKKDTVGGKKTHTIAIVMAASLSGHFAILLLVFKSNLISGNVEICGYFSESVSLNSWVVQSSFPDVHSSTECASRCSIEHRNGNDCCYLVRYDDTAHVCEIGKKSEDMNWNGPNLRRISSKLEPDWKISKYWGSKFNKFYGRSI